MPHGSLNRTKGDSAIRGAREPELLSETNDRRGPATPVKAGRAEIRKKARVFPFADQGSHAFFLTIFFSECTLTLQTLH
jgi:hypothetical protein